MSQLPPSVPYASPVPAQVGEQLAAARVGAKKIRRAVSYAKFDAWTIALFAAISFACGLFGGFSGIIIGVVMGAIAFVEFKGAARLRRLDSSAVKMLAYNQLAFAGMLIVYALWSIHGVANGAGMSDELKQQLAQVGDFSQIEEWLKTGFYLVYALLIAIAIFAQGGTAIYYYTRAKHIQNYIQTTPAWVIDMQRAGAPL